MTFGELEATLDAAVLALGWSKRTHGSYSDSIALLRKCSSDENVSFAVECDAVIRLFDAEGVADSRVHAAKVSELARMTVLRSEMVPCTYAFSMKAVAHAFFWSGVAASGKPEAECEMIVCHLLGALTEEV